MHELMKKSVVLAMIAITAGCESATAPGMSGPAQMEVEVRGDEASGISAYRAAQTGSTASGSANGRIDVSARVYLQTRGGEWIALGEAAARQTVDASGKDGYRPLIADTVQVASYTRVRVEFDQVDTWISGEIDLGGALLSGLIRVDAGSDGKATVEREIRIDARSESISRLRIDLNADAWLNRASSGSRVVGEAEFTSAIQINAD